jgi:hypothetical protein
MCIKPIGDKKEKNANSALFDVVFLRKAVGMKECRFAQWEIERIKWAKLPATHVSWGRPKAN